MVRTTFVPDEYYQSVERSYSVIFGRGIVTWEWTEPFQLRSYIYLTPYLVYFSLCKGLQILSPAAYIVGPRVLTAVYVAVSDMCLYLLAVQVARTCYTRDTSKCIGVATLALHLSSWSVMYMSTRTLVNTVEMASLVVITYLWQSTLQPVFAGEKGKDKPADRTVLPPGSLEEFVLMMMAVAVCARPTAAPVFTSMVLHRMHLHGRFRLLWRCVLYGGMMVGLCITFDSTLYKIAADVDAGAGAGAGNTNDAVVFPLWNFLKINTIAGVSALYGRESIYWNVLQGLPTMLGGFVPLTLAVMYFLQQRQIVLPTALLQLLAYGGVGFLAQTLLSQHQEIRFLLPTMAYTSLLLGHVVGLCVWEYLEARRADLRGAEEAAPPPSSENKGKKIQTARNMGNQTGMMIFGVICLACLGCLCNGPGALYLLVTHQSGTETAMQAVAQHIQDKFQYGTIKTGISAFSGGVYDRVDIHLLAPCHAFPGYSFMHLPQNDARTYAAGYPQVLPVIHMPDCSPYKLTDADGMSSLSLENTQSAQFVQNPRDYMTKLLQNQPLPDVIVTFSAYREVVESVYASLMHEDVGEKRRKSRNKPLRLIQRLSHASFRYDYDSTDDFTEVLIYSRL